MTRVRGEVGLRGVVDGTSSQARSTVLSGAGVSGRARSMLVRALVAVALVVVGLAWGSQPAEAQLAATLRLSPSASEVGGTVEARGSGFPPACLGPVLAVHVDLAGATVATAGSDPDGTFVAPFTVPAVTAGTHEVAATCRASVGPDVARAMTVLTVVPVRGPEDRAAPLWEGAATPATTPTTDATASGAGQAHGAARPTTSVVAPPGDAGPSPTGQGGSEATPLPAGGDEGASGTRDAPAADEGRPQQDAAPITAAPETLPIATDEGATAPEAWAVAESIPLLADAHVTARSAATATLLLVIYALLIGFPSVLVDGTFRNNYDAIVGGARRRFPTLHHTGEAVTARVPLAPLLGATAVGALAGSFLDPTIGWNLRTGAIVVGLAVVVATASWLGWLPTKITSDAYGNEGRYRAYPVAMILAIGCVFLSRALDFAPGYLYGLLFAYDLRGRWSQRDDGATFAAGFALVLVVGMGAWASLPVTHAMADVGLLGVSLDTVAVGLTLAGIEGVVFGMLPFTFAPGRAVWTWSKTAFLAVYVPAAVAFVAMLSGPQKNLIVGDGTTVSTGAVAGFAVYAAASVGFWSYWRRRRAREDSDRGAAGSDGDGATLAVPDAPAEDEARVPVGPRS